MRPDLEDFPSLGDSPAGLLLSIFLLVSQYMSILIPSHGQRTSSYCPYALIVLARFPPLHHVRESEREAETLTSFKILSPATSSLSCGRCLVMVEVKLLTLVIPTKAFIKVDAVHSNVVTLHKLS
jgi:hypothetical protein